MVNKDIIFFVIRHRHETIQYPRKDLSAIWLDLTSKKESALASLDHWNKISTSASNTSYTFPQTKVRKTDKGIVVVFRKLKWHVLKL